MMARLIANFSWSFLSVAWPTGVQLMFFLLLQIFGNVWRPGPISIARQLNVSVNPRFEVVIMIYLFVLDDSLTYIFATRTKQLTKCCEPLQKLRVRL